MFDQSTVEKIYTLTPSLQEEVADFVEFLWQKRLPEQANGLGKHEAVLENEPTFGLPALEMPFQTGVLADTFDIEEMKRAQNWTKPDRDEVFRLIKEMDVQEPIELLLSQLSQ